METSNNSVVYLTTQDFKDKVFNYETHQEWKYEGNLPAIIDFYADWCQPCKMVAPVLQDIAKDYAGKLIVYKVNTENERELSEVFGISSIPRISRSVATCRTLDRRNPSGGEHSLFRAGSPLASTLTSSGLRRRRP